jgi:hypothetical protein
MMMDSNIFKLSLIGFGIICFMITGFVLFFKGNKKNDKGMIYLGLSYLIMVIFYIFWGLKIGNFILYYSLLYFVYMGINFFTKNTFYLNQKSSFTLISSGTTLVYLTLVIPRILEEIGFAPGFRDTLFWRYQDNIFSIIFSGFSFGWLAISASNSLQNLKKAEIQPWIIKRIRIVIISSVVEIFVHVPDLINVMTNRTTVDIMFYVQIFIMLFFMITQYFAWVMPSFFKKYLNRGYSPPNDEGRRLSDEKIMTMMRGDISE